MKPRDDILKSPLLRRFAHLFEHPSLWHLNRRSVPRALGLGLFAAFIVPVGQIALAALLAIPARANVPLAAAATFVSNPFTFGPIYYAAFKTGELLLRSSSADGARDAASSMAAQLMNVSAPTAVGLIIFACVSSLVGYFAGALWWRLRLIRRWRRK